MNRENLKKANEINSEIESLERKIEHIENLSSILQLKEKIHELKILQ